MSPASKGSVQHIGGAEVNRITVATNKQLYWLYNQVHLCWLVKHTLMVPTALGNQVIHTQTYIYTHILMSTYSTVFLACNYNQVSFVSVKHEHNNEQRTRFHAKICFGLRTQADSIHWYSNCNTWI